MSNLPSKTDVTIIGAGPSGAAAAAILVDHGFDVCVIEKSEFPRFVIGESLLPRCMDMLEQAGLLDAVKAQGYLKKDGAVFARGDDRCTFSFGDQYAEGWDHTYQVPRADFDKVLIGAAESKGAKVFYRHAVTAVKTGDAPVTTIEDPQGRRHRLASRFVVDASGYGRVLPKLLNLDRPSHLPERHSLFTWVESDRRPEGIEGGRTWVCMHPGGAWIWIIPFADGTTSVGVVAEPEFLAGFPENPELRLRAILDGEPTAAKRLMGAAFAFEPKLIKGYSIGVEKLHGPGYCLVGNTMEFLDPVFSSGVTLALESSVKAATIVARQLSGEPVDWKTEYHDYVVAGVEAFKTYVDAWYDGSLPTLMFAQEKPIEIVRQITSVLAGHVWNTDNPYVVDGKRRVKALARQVSAQQGTGTEIKSNSHQVPPHENETFDVVICGGGMAGLTLSLQLRQELPDLKVAVLEKQCRPLPRACHKIGESAVELGSMYLEDLGLESNLRENHILKLGLRFFPGGGELPLHQRAELGPSDEPRVVSYQIDRGRFEEDMRAIAEERGVTLLEGAKVNDFVLGDGDAAHTVIYSHDDEKHVLKTRWLVGATGRNALFKRRLKLRRASGHKASSGWFRVKGRVDITEMVPRSEKDWHSVPLAHDRWRSTNHLMGEGYWMWLIPLADDITSVGMVVHDAVHGFESVRSLKHLRDFIRAKEPEVAQHLEDKEVLDFMCLSGFSHGVSRSFSADRWAIVGEAGAFLDPLYSNGTDFIALANSLTTEVIRADYENEALEARAAELNLQYHAFVSGSVDIFRKAAPIYAHARAMAAKIHWDNYCYWNFPCQYYRQGLFRLKGEAHAAFADVAMRFVQLSGYVQTLAMNWATMAPEPPTAGFVPMPKFPSMVIDAHMALMERMSPEETLAYMEARVKEGAEIVAELVLRVVQEFGPERGQAFLDAIGYADWDLPVDPERFAAESLGSVDRRKAVSEVVRDIERNLGRVNLHEHAGAAMAMLANLKGTAATQQPQL